MTNEHTRTPVSVNRPDQVDPPAQPGLPPHEGMLWIPSGTFLTGSNQHYSEESPTHHLNLHFRKPLA